MDARIIAAAVERRSSWLEDALRQLVEVESPSEDADAVNRAMKLAAVLAAESKARAKYHKQKGFGDVLEMRFGRPGPKPVLLLGHLDTVWPANTLKAMSFRKEAGRIYGPGVLDMKAGVVMALTAVSALQQLKIRRPVTLLLNSEEEVGSPVSRLITEELARESAAVFVLEPAQGLAYKTARKGVGHYFVEVTGVGAHSGVDFEKGHSAVLELAKQVQMIANFTDLPRKMTVNCGVYGRNTVKYRPGAGSGGDRRPDRQSLGRGVHRPPVSPPEGA